MEEELIYNYKKDTKEFIGACLRFIDPMETKIKGETVYMDPPNSTVVEPPCCAKGTVPVFDEDKGVWNIVDDYRGQIIYNKKTKEGYLLTELGPVPNGYSLEVPVTLQDLKDTKISELNKLFKDELNKKLKVNKLIVSVSDRPELDSHLVLFSNHEENVVSVGDNVVLMRKEEVEDVSNILFERSMTLFKIKEDLTNKILCCKNKTQLNKISLNFEVVEEKED